MSRVLGNPAATAKPKPTKVSTHAISNSTMSYLVAIMTHLWKTE